jgi:hypothetical protein
MATDAQRQAAYRRRRRDMIDGLMSARGLPPLPSVSTIPGWPRWKEAMSRIAAQLEVIDDEMTDYYDERSERWQESERAESFDESLNILRTIMETAQAWPD